MAIQITRQGGFLKVVIDSVLQTPISLDEIDVISVKGSNVILNNGTTIDYNDVSSPVVAGAEDLADSIADFIYQYNTGA